LHRTFKKGKFTIRFALSFIYQFFKKNLINPFTSLGSGLIIIMENSKIKPIISKGLYTPQLESDACGTGLIANLKGNKSHELIEWPLRKTRCLLL